MSNVFTERQQRFLTAYSEHRAVKLAAAHAGIHRATVYRWQADPAFKKAMDAAWKAGYQHWYKTEYLPAEQARRAARDARNAEQARRMREARQAALAR